MTLANLLNRPVTWPVAAALPAVSPRVTPPLNAAIVIDRFEPARGGAEKYANGLAEFLVDRGHTVHIYARHIHDPHGRYVAHPIAVHGLRRHTRVWSFAAALRRELSQNRHDVVHGLGKHPGSSIVNPHGGVEAAYVERWLESVDSPMYRFYLRLLRFMGASDAALMRAERDQYVDPAVQRFLAIAPMVRDDMLRWHGVEPMRVQVLMNGVDLSVFQPPSADERNAVRAQLGVPPGKLIGLMVSHNHRLKGLGPVIRALGALRSYRPDLDTELWVVGKGRTLEYRAIAALNGYSGRVRFWGSQEQMVAFYKAADALLAPSFYDAASLVVLEGMATGLPVLTTRQNGSSAVISSWEEGYVIDSPNDRAAMLEGLTYVFGPRARQTMGVAARKRAEQFPVNANFAAVERIYAECREERNGAPTPVPSDSGMIIRRG